MTDTRAPVTPIDQLRHRQSTRVRGRIVALNVEPRDASPQVTARISDGTGQVFAVFLGRREIPGIEPGRTIEVEGLFGGDKHIPLVYNPRYELLCQG